MELTHLLGQQAVVERLCRDLARDDVHLARLTGQAGAGKSHIARAVAATWRAGDGGVVVAVGDDEHSWRDLYPLLSGLSAAPRGWGELAMIGTRSAATVADSALPVSGAGTSIFDLLGAAFRQGTERALKPYAGPERDIILDLKRLARSGPLLIVADNGHWWDAESLRLLADIVGTDLRQAIPQLQSVSVLLVDTAEEQPVTATDAFESLAALCEGHTERVTRCTLGAFRDVLRALGLTRELPEGVVRALFSATDGHLKLAEQIAAYAEHNMTGSPLDAGDDDYLSKLVSVRVASLGASSPSVTTMLAAAAVLGLSFTERDLLCMAGGKPSELRDRIEQAESIGFVARSVDRIAFSHDVIRSGVLRGRSGSELRALHAKLAECLTILRPGDYAARAQALLEAGDADSARDMVALAAVGALRRGVRSVRALSRVSGALPDDPDLIRYVEIMGDGYAAVDAGDYTRVIPGLRTSVPSESIVMAAERNYLAAIRAMELQTAAGFAEARQILSSWEPELENEVELQLRFSLLLQQAYVLLEMFDEARETELRIERKLHARARYDLDAAVLVQVQNRRASAVTVPEVAEAAIRESVSFFRRGTQDVVRDRLELYRSLNNLAACQLRLGKDGEAYLNAGEAERIAVDTPDIVHRLDVLASNAVVAGYRSAALTVDDALARQRLVIESPEGGDDKFLHRCNLVAFLLLASLDDEAADELERLGHELHTNEFAETYLIFYWGALRVTHAAVRGDLEDALAKHTEMDAFAASLRWPTAPYARRRQDLLRAALPGFEPPSDRMAVDRLLLDTRPSEIGPAWAYYGRLMPCAELSFWSDS